MKHEFAPGYRFIPLLCDLMENFTLYPKELLVGDVCRSHPKAHKTAEFGEFMLLFIEHLLLDLKNTQAPVYLCGQSPEEGCSNLVWTGVCRSFVMLILTGKGTHLGNFSWNRSPFVTISQCLQNIWKLFCDIFAKWDPYLEDFYEKRHSIRAAHPICFNMYIPGGKILYSEFIKWTCNRCYCFTFMELAEKTDLCSIKMWDIKQTLGVLEKSANLVSFATVTDLMETWFWYFWKGKYQVLFDLVGFNLS